MFFTGLALATLATSSVVNIVQQRKAAKETKKSSARLERIADIKAARARVKAVREARVRRAEISQSAESTGAGAGSAVAGAQASIQQQVGSEISFLDQVRGLSKEASVFQQRAVDARATGAIAQSIGNVAGSFISPEKVESLFK